MKRSIRGVHYGTMGVWPTFIFESESNGFIEVLAKELGKYLGIRYWKKAVFIKEKNTKPFVYTLLGILFEITFVVLDAIYNGYIAIYIILLEVIVCIAFLATGYVYYVKAGKQLIPLPEVITIFKP